MLISTLLLVRTAQGLVGTNASFGSPVLVAEIGTYGYALGLASGDFDNDGDIDLMASTANGDVLLFDNNGNAAFTYTKTVADAGDGAYGLAAADLDDDNDVDLLVGNVAGQVFLYRNDGTGAFSGGKIATVGPVAAGIACADFDGDGSVDFIVGEFSGYVRLFKNNGDGTFTYKGVIADVGYCAFGLASADFDADFDPDIIAGNSKGEVKLIRNDGDKFTMLGTLAKDSGAYGLTAADFDLDGLNDFAAGWLYGDIRLWTGDGPCSFQHAGLIADIGYRARLTSADYDDDGDTDLLAGVLTGSSGGYGRIYLHRNTMPSNNKPPIADAGPNQKVITGDTVSFDGSGSYDPDGSIVNYTWDLGDGCLAYGVTATHVYAVPGTYTVALTVIDDSNAKDVDTCRVMVGPDPSLTSEDIAFAVYATSTGLILNITANVTNLGAECALNVTVQFFNGSIAPENELKGDIYNPNVFSIAAGEGAVAWVEWPEPPTETDLTIYVVVDLADTLAEANEDNNQAHRTVTISSEGIIINVSGHVNDVFSNVFVTFAGVEVYNESDGWLALSMEPMTVDLLWLCEHDECETIYAGKLDAARYTKMRLVITDAVGISKENGEAIVLALASELFEVSYTFDVQKGAFTLLTVHIDLEASVVRVADELYVFGPVLERVDETRHALETSLTPQEASIKPGDTMSFTFTIKNSGEFNEVYSVLLITEIADGWLNLERKRVRVPAGSNKTLALDCEVPADLPLMADVSYNITVMTMCSYSSRSYFGILISEVVGQLTVLATKESMIRYIIMETESLIDTVDAMTMLAGIKVSLISKLESALDSERSALASVLDGKERRANNMLECAETKLEAFIEQVEALNGKKLSGEDADTLLNASDTLVAHIEKAIATPL